MNTTVRLLLVVPAIVLGAACTTDVQVKHSPAVARSTDTITFTAEAITNTTPDSLFLELFVNGSPVKSCNSSPCVYTGGPYAGGFLALVSFRAKVTAEYEAFGRTWTQTDEDGPIYTGITDSTYTWLGQDYIPARYAGSTSDLEDLVFHQADDYGSGTSNFADFLDDVEDKIYDILGGQELVDVNLSKLNMWVYKKQGEAGGCGTVHDDADTDMPWRDDDAVLHETSFQDCTNAGLTHFSAEGFNTKAFLHESGHAVFGLGDEYDGPTNYSIVQSPEQNIFPNESSCRAEQNAKNRDPDECYRFTTRDGGWWGIHQGTTIMIRGLVGDDWYTEGSERVVHYFDSL